MSTVSAVLRPFERPRFLPQAGVVALLIAEVLLLTFTFDTAALSRASLGAAGLIGWSPQVLRLAIAVLGVTVLAGRKELLAFLHRFQPRLNARWPYYLAAHLVALAAFTAVTATVMGPGFAAMSHHGLWAIAWVGAGLLTLVSWGAVLLAGRLWLEALRQLRWPLTWGVLAGSAGWAGGFITEEVWRPLAGYTFAVVRWIVHGLYSDVVSDAAQLMIGTDRFRVTIAGACSGYEGIGLILAFLTVYLWLSRHTLRFPRALILLPLGAAAVWILNALRIAVLIVIGTSGWPAVALSGFHSQAGWIAFNAVGLGLVALTIRGRYFVTTPDAAAVRAESDPTAAYLAPFLAILGTAMVTGAFSSGFDWLYPARVMAAIAALWTFRRTYRELRWSCSWGAAIGIGLVTFLAWIALMPAGVHDKDAWPAALHGMGGGWAAVWLAIRGIGYIVTVPIAEELAFRGFMPRRLVRADFQTMPMGELRWLPWLISSLLFGAMHGSLWLAGTMAGMLFGLALARRRSLGDAVVAHATTNLLLAVYALTTGRWSVWS